MWEELAGMVGLLGEHVMMMELQVWVGARSCRLMFKVSDFKRNRKPLNFLVEGECVEHTQLHFQPIVLLPSGEYTAGRKSGSEETS